MTTGGTGPVDVPDEAVVLKRQPCNDYRADWRGEHEPHDWERREGQFVHCRGRAFTREQRWDQALGGWTVFRDTDGCNGIRAATDEETRAECMALADVEVAAERQRLHDRIEAVAAGLVFTDALTPTDPETLRPEAYIVEAANVPYLVGLVLAALVSEASASSPVSDDTGGE